MDFAVKNIQSKTNGLITLHKHSFVKRIYTILLKYYFLNTKKRKKINKKKMRLKNVENLGKSRLRSKFTVSYITKRL